MLITHTNNIVWDLVGGDNNIFVTEQRPVLSNIRVFIDFASFYDFYRGLCIRSDSVVCFVFVFFV